MNKQSPYQILGIRVGASPKEIRRTYRALAMKHHPDRNPQDPRAEEKFKEIQQAYETVSGANRTMGDLLVTTSRWGFDYPFSDFSDPFFNFYMLAKKCFFVDQDKEPSSKKRRGKGNR